MSSSGDCDTFDSSLEIAEAEGTVLSTKNVPPALGMTIFSGRRLVITCCSNGLPAREIVTSSMPTPRSARSESSVARVTTITATPGVRPIRVSPDGDRILLSTHDGQNYTELWSIDADGSNTDLVPNAEGDWQRTRAATESWAEVRDGVQARDVSHRWSAPDPVRR